MADDSVKQVAYSSPTASVNAHPSTVYRRPGERRRGREREEQEEREHKKASEKEKVKFKDTVTLSKGAKAAGSKKDASKTPMASRQAGQTSIDIRI